MNSFYFLQLDAREFAIKSGPESAVDAENHDAESVGNEVIWKNGNIPIAKSIIMIKQENQIIPDGEEAQKNRCTQFYEPNFQIALEKCRKLLESSDCPGTVNCYNGDCVCCENC